MNRSKLQAGQRITVIRPMWGLEVGAQGVLVTVSSDRITGGVHIDDEEYPMNLGIITLPLSHLAKGE